MFFEEELMVVSGRKHGLKLPRNLHLEQLARRKPLIPAVRKFVEIMIQNPKCVFDTPRPEDEWPQLGRRTPQSVLS